MDYDYEDCELSPRQRKEKKQKKLSDLKDKLKEELGSINPIEIKPRAKIAKKFWAKKWYENLSEYEDLDYRLQTGRQLLSAGAVVDFKVEALNLEAKVFDESLYDIKIKFKKVSDLSKDKISKALQKELCSLNDLLLGKVSGEICQIIVDKENGLFPSQEEISFDCNCMDYAELCSHVAACLCSVVVLFDQDPSIFFQLRDLEPQELIKSRKKTESKSPLKTEDLSQIFGIQLDS